MFNNRRKNPLMLLSLFPFLVTAQSFISEERTIIRQGNAKEKMYVLQTNVTEDLNILKSISRDISPYAKDLDLLIDRMYATVTDLTDGGVGISAPQVGVNRNVIWVQRFDKPEEPFEVYINPKIIWRSKLIRKGIEGCLSIPEIMDDVYRNYTIEIEYLDRKGKKHTEKVEGYTAVIFQHEIDHLNGILFTDRIEEQGHKEFQPINSEVDMYLLERLLRQ